MCNNCIPSSHAEESRVEDTKQIGPFITGQIFSFTTPTGTISEAGRDAIRSYIYRPTPRSDDKWLALNPGNMCRDVVALPDDWEWVWEVKDKTHKYGTGKFTKRFEKFVKNTPYRISGSHDMSTSGLRCPKDFIEELGNIARSYSSDPITYHFDFTNDLSWEAGDFGDNGSCWWHTYHQARPTLTNGGGLAVRFYTSAGDDKRGMGRAWLAPAGENYVCFNGYGFRGDSTLIISQLVSQHLGVSYKKIGLDNRISLMYINSETGFLIGPHDKVTDVSYVTMKMGPRVISCCKCGNNMHETEAVDAPDGSTYCRRCYDRNFAVCADCGVLHKTDDMKHVAGVGRFCVGCIDRHGVACTRCNSYHTSENLFDVHGQLYCQRCRDYHFFKCADCKKMTPVTDRNIRRTEDRPFSARYVCSDCMPPVQQEMFPRYRW